MKRYLSLDRLGFILMLSAGETVVSAVVLIGQSAAWFLILPVEFVVLVAMGVLIMGWD